MKKNHRIASLLIVTGPPGAGKWDLGEAIVDPDQQPEVTSRRTLIANAVASVVFPKVGPPLRIATLDLACITAHSPIPARAHGGQCSATASNAGG
jgi:hypothetical protein